MRVGRPSQTIDDGSLGEGDGPEGARMFRRGAELGRYVVLDRVGAGAMGVVLAAFDSQLDRKVALKVLLSHPGADSSEGEERLVREAKALTELSHPNIVAVHDAGTIDGHPYVAMEFVAGQTLRRWLAEAERPVAQVVDVFVAAGRGLTAAHAAGFVHRDVKPDNIMIADDGTVRVMDFGLARAPSVAPDDDASAAELTRRGAVVGTPAYMSPEQHAGRPADARSDQFSFCVALYEALFGRRPFAGTTLPELARNVRAGGPIAEPPAHSVPPSIRAAVLRGLATDPAARFASMDDLLAALEHDPGRARRRWLVGGVVTAFALVTVAASLVAERRRVAACTLAAAELGEVWNDATRDAVRTAWVGSRERIWPEVERRLDAHADRWRAASEAVCLASRVDTDFTLDERARSEHCLARSKATFTALVGVLADADATVASRAVDAAAELPSPDGCRDPQQLPTLASPAGDDALRHRLDRAQALHAVGEHEDALALLEDFATADESGLRAEARTLRGDVERDLGLTADAAASYEAAFFDAVRAGHDRVAARAATTLAVLAVARDPAQATRWIQHADAALERAGGGDALLAAEIDEARSALAELEDGS